MQKVVIMRIRDRHNTHKATQKECVMLSVVRVVSCVRDQVDSGIDRCELVGRAKKTLVFSAHRLHVVPTLASVARFDSRHSSIVSPLDRVIIVDATFRMSSHVPPATPHIVALA